MKARGLAYERELAKALPQAHHGVWFEFEDTNGHGYCQPDFILELGPRPTPVFIIETKLRWTLEGHLQVEGLYVPVVEATLGRKAIGGEVCKVLVPGAGAVLTRSLPELIRAAGLGHRAVLHWLGNSPLWP